LTNGLVGAAPQGHVNVRDLAAVIAHVGELVVQVVAHQVGQGEIQSDQYDHQYGDDP
jgi:hypothetical protein